MEYLLEEGKIQIKKEIIEFMKYKEDESNIEESIIELRENYTYGVDLEVKDEEQLNNIEKLCVEFIGETRSVVYSE